MEEGGDIREHRFTEAKPHHVEDTFHHLRMKFSAIREKAVGRVSRAKLVSLEKLTSLACCPVRQVEAFASTEPEMICRHIVHRREIRSTIDETLIVKQLRLLEREFEFVNLIHLREQFEMAVEKSLPEVVLNHH